MLDPYAVLGVARNAGQNEIKTAYRRLARKYHPDVNPHPAAARKFAQINEAYHILIDPQRRSFYERTGSTSSEISARKRWFGSRTMRTPWIGTSICRASRASRGLAFAGRPKNCTSTPRPKC